LITDILNKISRYVLSNKTLKLLLTIESSLTPVSQNF